MPVTIADLATLEDAVVRAAVRFVGCLGEFEGELKYCGECLDALETAVVRLEKGRDENLQALAPAARRRRCDDCGINWADLLSHLCPGCEAYREHTGAI